MATPIESMTTQAPSDDFSAEVVACTSEEETQARTVSIALDDSERSRDAFSWAVANLYRPMDKLVMLHASERPMVSTMGAAPAIYQAYNEEKREAREMLRNYAKYCAANNIAYEAKLCLGPRDLVFVEMTEKTQSSVLVLGNHTKGSMERLFVGSTSESALHNSHIPVAIVKKPHVVSMNQDVGRRIAIAVDGSEEARAAFDWAAKELHRDGDVFYIIHMASATRQQQDEVVEVQGGEAEQPLQNAAEFMESLSIECSDRGIDYHLITSRTHHSLPEELVKLTESLSVDMLVVGCRVRRGTLERLLFGSFSDRAVRLCKCNIIVVKKN